MKTILLSFLILLVSQLTFGKDEFYSKAYGKIANPAIIFLHGGPGYNAFSFEFSTAQKLADEGFYVIVYDQRGSGRTAIENKSLYTFEEAFEDLNAIYKKHKVESATLIGHSFGGTLGILFSKKHPEKVNNLILVGSPLSYQMTFKNIISRCKKIYTETASPQLQYIEMLEKMDSTTLDYSSYCFMHAMMNGFYKAKNPSSNSKSIYENLKAHPQASYISNMTKEPVAGFFENEKYTTLNLTLDLAVLKSKINVFGIYGQEDGLFDGEQISLLQSAIGAERFALVENASHSVFIDQQENFISLVKKYLSEK